MKVEVPDFPSADAALRALDESGCQYTHHVVDVVRAASLVRQADVVRLVEVDPQDLFFRDRYVRYGEIHNRIEVFDLRPCTVAEALALRLGCDSQPNLQCLTVAMTPVEGMLLKVGCAHGIRYMSIACGVPESLFCTDTRFVFAAM